MVGSISDQPSGAALRRPNFFIPMVAKPGFGRITMLLFSSRARLAQKQIFKLNFSSISNNSTTTPSTASATASINSQLPNDNDPPSSNKYSLVNPLYKLIMKSKLTADPDLARFLAKSAAFSAYGLASMTALGTIGIDTTPLLTGIGITGFTIGFALKEIATNFLSGVMLVFGKPFKKGQWLKVLGPSGQQQLEGEVQSIDARYVLLRTKDRGVVMIPSVVVYTNPILVSATSNGNGTSPSNGNNNDSTSSKPTAKEESK